ncbi:hypothetical protein CBS101457_001803 [Exobasidium rhododendri]|nr:hypothetical protein CBS101457_001803 [Exobasidium rhododendri]
MLVRPSVTPRNHDEHFAGFPTSRGKSLPHQPRSTVRFHPEVRQICPHNEEYDDSEDVVKSDEEDFPIRKRPVKGRKQTAFSFARQANSSTESVPSVSQAPKHIPAITAVDFDGESEDEELAKKGLYSKAGKGVSMGMASKIAGAFKLKSKRSTMALHSAQNQCEHINTDGNFDAENRAGNDGGVDKNTLHTTCMTDAFVPVFAEGISHYQPKATYSGGRDNKVVKGDTKNKSERKHGFARIVETARMHTKGGMVSSTSTNNTPNLPQEEEAVNPVIAPRPRAKLLELAKTAKVKAQQKNQSTAGSDRCLSVSLDEEPGWKCAGLDYAATLLDDSLPLPSLTIEPATPQHDNESEQRHVLRKSCSTNHLSEQKGKTVRKSSSRHRLADCERAESSADIVRISRDDRQASTREEHQYSLGHSSRHRTDRERSHSRSRHRSHRDTREPRDYPAENEEGIDGGERRKQAGKSCRSGEEGEHLLGQSHRSRQVDECAAGSSMMQHRSHDPSSTTSTKVPLPDKRKGKLLSQGAETQRLNLALTMAKTRMEMGIAEQQEAQANANQSEKPKGAHFVKDEEEKAWLNEAYEEAVKREVESMYLYDAHTIGGSW